MGKSTCVLLGLLLITTCFQVESLMWNSKPGGINSYRPGYNIGWRENYGEWETRGRSYPWSSNTGVYGTSWNFPTGNMKGSNYRRCVDSRQCYQGECCQATGFSNLAACVYGGYAAAYGCNDRQQNLGWPQRQVYPGNNKGSQITATQFGRPGACPPPQFLQGPMQYCRNDENCPTNKKCCYFQGKTVCLHPIFH
ncbi:hypothetical protein AVEN_263641-1 [Araneus ventricosus]|uniref:WAP domain-containing protein n=1 Tax=Araneus ventricosus TaxID=182803 RepID=A0A4Y2ARP5_ARAVE|nr:hypothetical protein AVEN_263641-1 [Araneus ventricosus]